MIVTITVDRGKGKPTVSCELAELGESKKGTFKTFGLKKETPDLPSFMKVYIKAERAES